MKQCVERPADPEILFDVLNGGAKARRCFEKETETIISACGDDPLIGRIHNRIAFSLACAAWGWSALIRSRKKTCIQLGMAERPLSRSRLSFGPVLGSLNWLLIFRSIRPRSCGSFNLGLSQLRAWTMCMAGR